VTPLLHVLRDPPLDGPTNMARDEHLLYSELLRPAAVRLYAWDPPTLSLGYFQRWAQVAELPADIRQLAIVRRTTGGGAILHDREVTYSLALDDTIPVASQQPVALYRLVHECWRAALAQHGVTVALAPDHFPLPTPRGGPFFCFAKPGRADLLLNGAKLLGSAQRRIKGRVLQHGSLLLGRRFAAHPGADLHDPPADAVARWTDTFIAALSAALGLTHAAHEWTAPELADVQHRQARYVDPAWTQRL
jgi:lipoate-protein ligase A